MRKLLQTPTDQIKRKVFGRKYMCFGGRFIKGVEAREMTTESE